MLVVEYLVIIRENNIKCSNIKTFNNLLQTDANISISKNKLSYKDKEFEYEVKFGKIKNTEENYFHLTFKSSKEQIDDFTSLLKAIKSILYIADKTPQILYDGISLHYSHLAYPHIFEIENLMRKLITKFMLTNVGIDWISNRIPKDVKDSINQSNKDSTFLHNVDFIQLKSFLFSENYPSHKENLIQKLKKAKDLSELNLEEIKELLPNSNWERYFSQIVDISKEKLSNKWDDLYELRCRIAHNRVFNRYDYDKVKELTEELRSIILKVINNLDKIDISEQERDDITDIIVSNFNQSFGDFLVFWKELIWHINVLSQKTILIEFPKSALLPEHRNISKNLSLLFNNGIIDSFMYQEIRHLTEIRNQIVHNNTIHLSQIELLNNIERARELIGKIKTLIKNYTDK